MELREATTVMGDATGSSSSDAGPSGSDGVRSFPLAAPPEIMRAAEKDEQYASFVYDACRDAFRHLFGTRIAVEYQSEVAGPYGLPPTPARRSLFILYQTAFPYIAERISSRIASQGISMSEMLYDDIADTETTSGSLSQLSARDEITSSLSSGVPVSALSRFKARIAECFHLQFGGGPQCYP